MGIYINDLFRVFFTSLILFDVLISLKFLLRLKKKFPKLRGVSDFINFIIAQILRKCPLSLTLLAKAKSVNSLSPVKSYY